MTQLFGRFAGPHAHVHVPGAAFLFAFITSLTTWERLVSGWVIGVAMAQMPFFR